jgi:exonuclease SbcC
VTSISAQIATTRALRAEQGQLAENERVAAQLARHLRADRYGFETWYVRQVVEHLTYSASETLKTLSQGQFSLALDTNDDFEVVDHANADTRRHIRTLSGGETFLASLSLALSLADSIATVAAGSTARLEAIFLDEGFGTLDPETLDVVATAIEELAAGGRMVGIVTHVAELAARMPVRYEVRRGPGGSTVERVDA